jgi:hypothetical protein
MYSINYSTDNTDFVKMYNYLKYSWMWYILNETNKLYFQ